MAAAPISFLEKRWAAGYQNNLLLEAAQQTSDRKQVPFLDNDVHRNISNLGRRTMLSLGRWLFSNFPAIRGALIEQAEFAGSTFLPEYRGANQEWGVLAENWLWEHGKICDVAGWPYNLRTYRRNLILGIKRDGDMGTILTETIDGYPMLQCVPAHRIGSRLNEFTVKYAGRVVTTSTETDKYGRAIAKGSVVNEDNEVIGQQEWEGQRIIDGVIVSELGGPLAYRVMGENSWDYSRFHDVSSRDMFLSFIPEYIGQLRGFSALGSSMFDWQDVKEAQRFELIAQKVGAAITLIEKNPEGEPTPGASWITTPAASAGTAGTAAGLNTEMFDGGLVRYLKSKSGADLLPFQNDRPSANQQQFSAAIIRSNFAGMGWSVDFSLDPTKIGGAPLRVVVDKINRSILSDQDLIIEPALRRYQGYALSKAIKLDLLPFDSDWWQFEYQGPAKLTADAKYNSDVDLQERKAGLKTLARSTAERGEDWEDVRNQSELEANDLLTRARRIADGHGITIELALTLLEQPTPNNNMPPASEPTQAPIP